jgi:hypothetical protein
MPGRLMLERRVESIPRPGCVASVCLYFFRTMICLHGCRIFSECGRCLCPEGGVATATSTWHEIPQLAPAPILLPHPYLAPICTSCACKTIGRMRMRVEDGLQGRAKTRVQLPCLSKRRINYLLRASPSPRRQSLCNSSCSDQLPSVYVAA